MPSITLLGAGHETVRLAYDSTTNARIAAQIAAAITSEVEAGSIIAVNGGVGPTTSRLFCARPAESARRRGNRRTHARPGSNFFRRLLSNAHKVRDDHG